MTLSPTPAFPSSAPHPGSAELEAVLAALEAQLAALGAALQARDGSAVESHANELPRALARAVAGFTAAARHGAVPLALRQRLVRASSVVAQQRESLARATAALDRAIDVLMPREAPNVYSAWGAAQRPASSGSLLA